MRAPPLPGRPRPCPEPYVALQAAAELGKDVSRQRPAASYRPGAPHVQRPNPVAAKPRSRCLRHTARTCAHSLQPRPSEQQHAVAAPEAEGIAERVTHVAVAILEADLRPARGI